MTDSELIDHIVDALMQDVDALDIFDWLVQQKPITDRLEKRE